ncbi:unnamed protein product [Microthlaspi erraticum]|uniref:Uncharacterized protein n=1 Tax=Microthlaspi erraticum TaxID=1685480 RepID=A0A6D2KLD4_9BRAS|nr:unnamed protein product [Microthlaspi erraticum]
MSAVFAGGRILPDSYLDSGHRLLFQILYHFSIHPPQICLYLLGSSSAAVRWSVSPHTEAVTISSSTLVIDLLTCVFRLCWCGPVTFPSSANY